MSGSTTQKYPWWVRLTLATALGATTRRRQWAYVVISLLSAAACVVAVLALPLRPSTALILELGAVGFIISAVWYLLAMRWIDTHGSWADIR
jgi:hypothetical protein